MIARRTIISQDLLDRFSQSFFSKWKRFGCRWLIWTSFSDISRDVAMATNFVEKWQTTHICRTGKPKQYGISLPQCAHSQRKWCLYIVKKIRELWSSNSRVDWAHLLISGTTLPKKLAHLVEYLRIYSTGFRNLFTIWKRFGCRWSIFTLFPDLSRDVAMATK